MCHLMPQSVRAGRSCLCTTHACATVPTGRMAVCRAACMCIGPWCAPCLCLSKHAHAHTWSSRGQLHGIHATSCACGQRVYTTCVGPQVDTCSMRGPGRTRVCTYHGKTCARGRPEPPRWRKEEGEGQVRSCRCQARSGGTGCDCQPLEDPSHLGWLGP